MMIRRLIAVALAASLCAGAARAQGIGILHSFVGGGDGAGPQAPLSLGAHGTLYGVTSAGGGGNCASPLDLPGCGTVFALTPPATGATVWTETILHRFTDVADGVDPAAGLLRGSRGILFGTTAFGGVPKGAGCGPGGCGTVFALSPPVPGHTNWTKTTLYSFNGGSDGSEVVGRLIVDRRGRLYGTTVLGGATGNGTVFRLSPPAIAGGSWTETILYAFAGTPDGAAPEAGLLAGPDGTLFGTTALGGSNGSDGEGGTVFALSPPKPGQTAWRERVLHRFRRSADGAFPICDLVADAAGDLFGTTQLGAGATFNGGTAFLLRPPAAGSTVWTETVLHVFGFGQDGDAPAAGLTRDAAGVLFGTTLQGGGPSGAGTVFALSPPSGGSTRWPETVLYRFTGQGDGGVPMAGPLLTPGGQLFGTGFGFGTGSFLGTVFRIVPPAG